MKHIAGNRSSSSLSHTRHVDIQPNAVDLRINKVFKICPSPMVLSEKTKIRRTTVELPPVPNLFPDEPGLMGWCLEPGVYEVIALGEIKIGPNEAGWVIPRSTLTRNGNMITGGLYDSGYEGVMGIALHVNCGTLVIGCDTRFAQFILFDAEALKQYNGSYGKSSEHDKLYEGSIYSDTHIHANSVWNPMRQQYETI